MGDSAQTDIGVLESTPIPRKRRSKRVPPQQQKLGLAPLPAIPSISTMRILKLAEETDDRVVDPYVLQQLKRRQEQQQQYQEDDAYFMEEGEVLPSGGASAKRVRRHPHKSGQKGLRKTFWCWICSHVFHDRTEHKKHLMVAHGMLDVEFGKWQKDGSVRTYECTDCGLQFEYPHKLMVHFRQTHAPRSSLPFVCGVCGWRFALRGNLTKHEAKVHGEDRPTNYQCVDCNSGYESKKEYTKHLRRVHRFAAGQEDDVFWCVYCTWSFFDPSRYITHVLEDHSDNNPQFFCRQCEDIYSSPNLFMEHGTCPPQQPIVPGRLNFPSNIQQPGAPVQRSVPKIRPDRQPRRRRDPPNKGPPMEPNNPDYARQPFYPYKCPTCGQLFQYEKSYQRHMYRQHGDGAEDNVQQMIRQGREQLYNREQTMRDELAYHGFVQGEVSDSSDEDSDDDDLLVDGAEVVDEDYDTLDSTKLSGGSGPSGGLPPPRTPAQVPPLEPQTPAGGWGSEIPECNDCGRICKTHAELTTHMKSHRQERERLLRATRQQAVAPAQRVRFQCPDCAEYFFRLDDLNNHRTEKDHWGLAEDTLGMLGGDPFEISQFIAQQTESYFDGSSRADASLGETTEGNPTLEESWPSMVDETEEPMDVGEKEEPPTRRMTRNRAASGASPTKTSGAAPRAEEGNTHMESEEVDQSAMEKEAAAEEAEEPPPSPRVTRNRAGAQTAEEPRSPRKAAPASPKKQGAMGRSAESAGSSPSANKKGTGSPAASSKKPPPGSPRARRGDRSKSPDASASGTPRRLRSADSSSN